MALAKRIFLFLALNLVVVLMITLVLDLLHVKPFLSSYGIHLQSLLIFCFIWGMGGALISLSLSRVMAKWMMGVQIIDPNTHDPELKHLVDTVHALARKSGSIFGLRDKGAPHVRSAEEKEAQAQASVERLFPLQIHQGAVRSECYVLLLLAKQGRHLLHCLPWNLLKDPSRPPPDLGMQ